MNNVTLIGRIVRDIDLKYLPGGGTAVAKFTLAVDRKFKKDGNKESDFLNITVFGKTAEYVAQYTSKGKMLAVAGRIKTGSYEKKDGTKVYTTDIMADEVQILEWAEKKSSSSFEDMTPVDDGSIPF